MNQKNDFLDNFTVIMIEKAATHQAHFLIKAFIAYVYFIQGFYLNLGSTIVLLYPKFPSPDVLSHFSIAYLPFSFKYVTGTFHQIKLHWSKSLQALVMGVENFG